MLVKNIGKKTIGFGAEYILPDQTKELPVGYGETHPTVEYYFKRNYLVKVDAESVADGETNPGGGSDTPGAGVELTEEEKVAAQKKAEIDAKIEALAKMNLEQLRGEAFALGVECAESDTKKMIAQKITEKLQTELG